MLYYIKFLYVLIYIIDIIDKLIYKTHVYNSHSVLFR